MAVKNPGKKAVVRPRANKEDRNNLCDQMEMMEIPGVRIKVPKQLVPHYREAIDHIFPSLHMTDTEWPSDEDPNGCVFHEIKTRDKKMEKAVKYFTQFFIDFYQQNK